MQQMGICQSYNVQMTKPESLSAAQYRKNVTEPALFIILPWYRLFLLPEETPKSLLEDYRVDAACYCYSTCCENQSCEQSYHRASDKDREKEEKKGKEEEEYNLKAKVSELLMERLPYLESVQIRRHLPDTLVVTVTESTAAAAVADGTGYLYLNRYGKVLEQNTSDGGLPVVTGVSLSGTQPGQAVAAGEDAYTDALLEVLEALDAGGMLDELSFLNLQDLTDVRIGYADRFDIRVGTLDDLSYRLRFAKTVIDERLSPSDIGRLYWDAQNRLHYVPDTAENVAASAAGTADTSPTVDLDSVIEDEPPADGETSDSGTDADEGDGAGYDEEDDAADPDLSYESYDEYDETYDEWYDETGDETAE